MSIRATSRRDFLERAGFGFGALAASHLLARDARAAVKAPHFPATAKSVIFLFMHGGPSHLETFDPKPLLTRLEGQPVPESFGEVQLQFSKFREVPLLGSRRTFQKYGQAGIEISDLFPNVARRADDLCVIRSCYHDGFTHAAALNWINMGTPLLGRPSVGAWVVYGLGSETDSLPAFVVMLEGSTKAGPPNYGAGFLPAMYQGTPLRSGPTPILNIRRPAGASAAHHREMLDLLKWNNERHLETRRDDTDLAARIDSYELAFRMQMSAPDLADLSKESEATKKLYGIDEPSTSDYGSRCLLARRMVERGVRFIQVYSGGAAGNEDWDGHSQCDRNHVTMSRKVDKPIAGLLADLKSRGLLDSTLVIWGGEFGRTPTTDGNALGGGAGGFGRDHNPYGFSMWMSGGGVKGGKVIGSTDEIGLRAVDSPVHPHDLHAAILALLGLDHKKLTHFFQGREFRLTDIGGDGNLVQRLKA